MGDRAKGSRVRDWMGKSSCHPQSVVSYCVAGWFDLCIRPQLVVRRVCMRMATGDGFRFALKRLSASKPGKWRGEAEERGGKIEGEEGGKLFCDAISLFWTRIQERFPFFTIHKIG